MFIAMLGHPDLAERDVSSLRTGIMAGSPCPVEVMKRCVDELNMSEVAIAYGMTETSPVSCQTLLDDDLERRTATVGRAHPHVEIKIVDPGTGAIVDARAARRVLHPRLLGDDSATGATTNGPGRPWTPTAGCTPAIWP